MSSEAQLATVYADDESIAVRAYGDFAALVPRDQVLAQGVDGVFQGSDLWTLTSASQNFQTQGVAVGHIVRLYAPTTVFKGHGNLFAVGSVNGNAITLRRPGKGDGVGLPPSPSGGLGGVSFEIKTFDPQIEDVSYEINIRYGIDPTWATAAPGMIADLRVLRQATVLTVLVRAYSTDARSKDGDFARKIAEFRQALSDVLGIVQVRWTQAINIPPPSSKFTTRIGR